MPTLACCYTDAETPFCDHRRFEGLPMCKKHMHETMRTAIFDALMPWDVMSELVTLTADIIKLRQLQERSEIREATRQREATAAAATEANRRVLGVVYYVRLSPDRIKIGRTINLKQRMSAMRIRRTDVLAVEPGGAGLEADRHAEFAELRHGRLEDFDVDPWLMEHIETVRQQWGDPWKFVA